MEALTDGVVVGRVQRFVFVTAGSWSEIDVSAYLESEVDSVQVEGPSTMNLGTNAQFTAYAMDADGLTLFSGAGFSWTSTDPRVLFVDFDTGFAIPRMPGDVTVKATLKGTALFGTLQVSVFGEATVSIDPPSASLSIFDQQQFTATVTGIPSQAVTWSIDEPTGGEITPSGLYTAHETAGTFHVRATSVDYPAATKTATVTVNNPSGWTYIVLSSEDNPGAEAFGVYEGIQVGMGGVAQHACLWQGSPFSFTDLHVPTYGFSFAFGVYGNQQVGTVHGAPPDPFGYAALWTGSPGSFVNLNPANAQSSFASSVWAGVQAGYVWIADGQQRASIWTGTAASWQNLHPAFASGSAIFGIYENTQVGWFQTGGGGSPTFAAMWEGTANSCVNLNPTGALGSQALDVYEGEQVGFADFGALQACMWTGSAASWVSLHPAGASASQANGVHGGMQVGTAKFISPHAGVWTGSAGSWFDLQSVMPPWTYGGSRANAIWMSQDWIYVVGQAHNQTLQRWQAVMWIHARD